jgi:hypothetical protein
VDAGPTRVADEPPLDMNSFPLGLRFFVGNYCGSNISLDSVAASAYVPPSFPEEGTVAWQPYEDFNQPLAPSKWAVSTWGDGKVSSNGRLVMDVTAPDSALIVDSTETLDNRSFRLKDIQEEPAPGRCFAFGYMDSQWNGVRITHLHTGPDVPPPAFFEVWKAGTLVTQRNLGSFGPGRFMDFTGVWTGSTLKVEVKSLRTAGGA